jgi:hypothetical protein
LYKEADSCLRLCSKEDSLHLLFNNIVEQQMLLPAARLIQTRVAVCAVMPRNPRVAVAN